MRRALEQIFALQCLFSSPPLAETDGSGDCGAGTEMIEARIDAALPVKRILIVPGERSAKADPAPCPIVADFERHIGNSDCAVAGKILIQIGNAVEIGLDRCTSHGRPGVAIIGSKPQTQAQAVVAFSGNAALIRVGKITEADL